MWFEIHRCRWLDGKLALYEGTADGYKITRVYATKVGAKLSAKIHGYKFIG